MRLLSILTAALVASSAMSASAQSQSQPSSVPTGGLQFRFVDVEGGAATLVLTPAGESILIDSGDPGDRDAGRIALAAREMGIAAIDHYITTHWHSDHFGGIGPLSKLLPIKAIYGHTFPEPLGNDIKPELVAIWKSLSPQPIFLSAGDSIALRGKRGTPTPKLKILAANGLVVGEKAGAPAITTCNDGQQPQPEDTSDNARSLAMLLTYGEFDLFAGGDLTWNIEHKLTCPTRIVSKVDVFLVNHHGLDQSNNPTLVEALAPEVAIVNSGPRKGAEPRTMALLNKQLRDVGVFQIHRNVRPGAINADPARIANEAEACTAQPLLLRVDPGGGHFTVTVPSRNVDREFSAR